MVVMVTECNFRSQSGSRPIRFLVGCPGRQCTQTLNSGTVRWNSPNPSGVRGLSAGCAVGPSVDL